MSATRMFTILLLVVSERQFVFSYSLNTWSPSGFEYKAALMIWNNNCKKFIESTYQVGIKIISINCYSLCINHYILFNHERDHCFVFIIFLIIFLKILSIGTNEQVIGNLKLQHIISWRLLTFLAVLLSGGPSINCLFRALVDSSIIVVSEPDDDPPDAGDGDNSNEDVWSEEDPATLLSNNTDSLIDLNMITPTIN